MKKFFKVLLVIVLILVVMLLGLLAWLTITEYKPAPVEEAVCDFSQDSKLIGLDDEINILSWNIGYGGLGEDSDFFMDGGKEVQAADEETVNKYITGIKDFIDSSDWDFLMLQEVDTDSQRTYGKNQTEEFKLDNSTFAYNYSCKYVPFPFPPMGKINSGLLTTTNYSIESAQRVALPCPFSWPVKTANLKRCLLVNYIPIEGSDKKIVLIDLHLEAYDDGEGKTAQTKMLHEFVEKEYEKGNYVIAGGDFNQTFPGTLEKYPITQTDNWFPPELDTSVVPNGWRLAYDTSTPTCRLLNKPYDAENKDGRSQYFVVDGFMISPNVELVKVENKFLDFENSDHHPVKLTVRLKAN